MDIDEAGRRLMELCRKAIEHDPDVRALCREMEAMDCGDVGPGSVFAVEINACVKVVEGERESTPSHSPKRSVAMTTRDLDFLKAMHVSTRSV